MFGGYDAFGFAADIHDDVVVLHGNNGSLQSLTGRIVRGVFALLLFELGEDIAKRRFFLGHGLFLEDVRGLLGLLHENCEGFVFILAHLRRRAPCTHYHGSGALHIPSPLAAAAGFRVAVAVFRAGAGKHRSHTSGDRACFQPRFVSGDRAESSAGSVRIAGHVWSTLIKLGVCYLLIGWTGGISSTYYVTLLLPVVSAATTLNLGRNIA